MIIISQNKDEIVNFKNIENIWIIAEEGRFTIEATAETNTSLGYYTTEERAKEVLEEITVAYANMEMLKIPKIHIENNISREELVSNICYKMPKE